MVLNQQTLYMNFYLPDTFINDTDAMILWILNIKNKYFVEILAPERWPLKITQGHWQWHRLTANVHLVLHSPYLVSFLRNSQTLIKNCGFFTCLFAGTWGVTPLEVCHDVLCQKTGMKAYKAVNILIIFVAALTKYTSMQRDRQNCHSIYCIMLQQSSSSSSS